MDIGIFTICYNGYGRFLERWCESISQSTTLPDEVTIGLFGDRHGLSNEMANNCKEMLPFLRIVHLGDHINIGIDRNKTVSETSTEWIMLLDADDAMVPSGLEEIKKHINDEVDVVVVSYVEEKTNGKKGLYSPPEVIDNSDIFDWHKTWISPYSPFRRSLWEKENYIDGEFPNVPMVYSFARQGVRWGKTDTYCVRYIRREDSHCGSRTRDEHIQITNLLNKYREDEEKEYKRRKVDS